MTIVAGAAVGILGVEGWGGFTVYVLSQLLVSISSTPVPLPQQLVRSIWCAF